MSPHHQIALCACLWQSQIQSAPNPRQRHKRTNTHYSYIYIANKSWLQHEPTYRSMTGLGVGCMGKTGVSAGRVDDKSSETQKRTKSGLISTNPLVLSQYNKLHRVWSIYIRWVWTHSARLLHKVILCAHCGSYTHFPWHESQPTGFAHQLYSKQPHSKRWYEATHHTTQSHTHSSIRGFILSWDLTCK